MNATYPDFVVCLILSKFENKCARLGITVANNKMLNIKYFKYIIAFDENFFMLFNDDDDELSNPIRDNVTMWVFNNSIFGSFLLLFKFI